MPHLQNKEEEFGCDKCTRVGSISVMIDHLRRNENHNIIKSIGISKRVILSVLEQVTFMSSSDIAKKYGKSRQYWEKIMKQGKIWSQ